MYEIKFHMCLNFFCDREEQIYNTGAYTYLLVHVFIEFRLKPLPFFIQLVLQSKMKLKNDIQFKNVDIYFTTVFEKLFRSNLKSPLIYTLLYMSHMGQTRLSLMTLVKHFI